MKKEMLFQLSAETLFTPWILLLGQGRAGWDANVNPLLLRLDASFLLHRHHLLEL